MGPRSRRHRIVWEGAQFVTHSLALVNRELCSRLDARGHSLSLQPLEPAAGAADGDPRLARLAELVRRPLEGPADLHVRHYWPPSLVPCAEGRLVLIQPWEFGSLPKAWIEPMNRVIDETWVPTPYVRQGYLRSGVAPERVHVVPNGVDTRRFHPDVPPLPLETERSFRFLFVGGTIPRKGVDILLQAYTRAFGPEDDVCLVIKDSGVESFYRGSTAHESIERLRDAPGVPEILYLDRTFSAEELPRLYTAADCLVHPYRGEGFGLPIAEAMSSARPVVITGHGAALAFCDSSCGWLIPAEEIQLPEPVVGGRETVERPWMAEPDPDALADLLRQVFEQRDEARRRGWMARERIRTRFTWEHAADACEARIEALLASAPSPRRGVTPDAPQASPSEQPEEAAPQGFRSLLWTAAPFNYSGYARISRTLLPALASDGLQVQLHSMGIDKRFQKDLEQRPAEVQLWNRLLAERVEGGVGCCFHPPASWKGTGFFTAFRRQNPGLDAHVGFTMFETDRLPPGWAEECAAMDEVWVPSRFNLETFARGGVPEEKLRLFQPGIDVTPFEKPAEPYPIPERRAFAFLSVFQWTLRKGWDVLLRAWAQAFSPEDDVCLVLRAYPGARKEPPIRQRIDDFLEQIGRSAGDCAPILLLEDFIDDATMPSLYAAADAFVLPSRGEAWGLPYLEAMASGLPTLGTSYGGQLDFLNDRTGYLIEIEGTEPVDPSQTEEDAYYAPDHRWASPSVAHTAELMREVYEDPERAREKARGARPQILAEWGVAPSVARLRELGDDLQARVARRGRKREVAAPAVLWQGPLFDPSGYADEARHFSIGLDAEGVSVHCRDLAWSRRRAELPEEDRIRLEQLVETPLLGGFVHVQHAFGRWFSPTTTALANVGRTMFETDRIPEDWVRRCNSMDEVWVPSAFNVETFAEAGVALSKLQVVPGVLDASRYQEVAAPLELEGRRGFNFLSIFDWSLRKGWDLLLRAYAEEFAADEDVCLFLKISSSQGMRPGEIQKRVRRFLKRRLGLRMQALPPLVFLADEHATDEMPRLYRAADAYVMPSRGEGWGRPYMEAMACGVPVIGTGWSGNTEYMDESNSFLIESDRVDVPEAAWKEAPQFQGHRWAEPRVEHLRQLMRLVQQQPEEARRRAERGRRQVLERFDRRQVALRMRERLAVLGGFGIG